MGQHTPRFCTLGVWTSVVEVADGARAAALAFLAASRSACGRREIAAWLLEHYAVATRPARSIAPRRGQRTASSDRIGEQNVEELVATVRRDVLKRLASARTWNPSSFQKIMLDRGIVAGAQDQRGAIGYAPVDVPDALLVDRVMSLFVADFLTRPDDYKALSVCASCGEASFVEPKHTNDCELRGVTSGIVVNSSADD
jgi:hypothetical protein